MKNRCRTRRPDCFDLAARKRTSRAPPCPWRMDTRWLDSRCLPRSWKESPSLRTLASCSPRTIVCLWFSPASAKTQQRLPSRPLSPRSRAKLPSFRRRSETTKIKRNRQSTTAMAKFLESPRVSYLDVRERERLPRAKVY